MPGLGKFDLLDLAEQGGGEFVGADAHDILPLPHQPAMAGVIGDGFGDMEATDDSLRRTWPGLLEAPTTGDRAMALRRFMA